MRFKHTVHLTCDLFSNVFKLLLYRIVTGVLFYSLTYLILWSGLSFVMNSPELSNLTGLFDDFFRALTDALMQGDPAALTEFQSVFHTVFGEFLGLLAANMGSIIGSVIGVAVMYLFKRFLNGIAHFAVGSIVNDKMATCSRTQFGAAFFRNIARASLYELLYVPLAFVYDLLGALACWFLFFYLPSLLPAWGVATVILSIALTVTAMIILQAFKLSFISGWMPAMVVGGMSVIGAFKYGAHMQKGAISRFGGFLIACYLIVFVNVGFALFTAGSGLLITIPLSFLFLIAMQYVNYYETEGTKYFLDRNTIVEPESAAMRTE